MVLRVPEVCSIINDKALVLAAKTLIPYFDKALAHIDPATVEREVRAKIEGFRILASNSGCTEWTYQVKDVVEGWLRFHKHSHAYIEQLREELLRKTSELRKVQFGV